MSQPKQTQNPKEIDYGLNPARKKLIWMIKREKETTVLKLAHLNHYRIERVKQTINRFLELGLVEFTGEQSIILTRQGEHYVYQLEQE